MDDLPGTLERLTARLEFLERRVEALEHPSAAPVAPVAQILAAQSAVETGEGISLASAGAFSVLGKAMLGIAGAYVLRAVAESGSVPKTAIAAIAIAYAIGWMVWAARVKGGEWFASATYAGTSALILAPMLWELTLRFNVLPPAITAAVLAGFVVAATVLAWKRDLAPVFWVANVTAAVAALALAIGTHQLTPFIAALLLMALICEYAAEHNHEMSLRPLVAVAADLGVWALIFIYTGPQMARAGYPELATAKLLLPGCLLFLIYAVSVAFRTVVQRQKITVFETGQAIAAFLLAAVSLLYFEPQGAALLVGVVCLLLAAGGYAAAFALFSEAEASRNFHVFATWSALLFLAGCALTLPSLGVAACLAVAAVAATVLGARLGHRTLEFHGLLYLVAAAIASGLLGYALQSLAGTLPAAPGLAVWLASASALACYALGKPGAEGGWSQQGLRLLTAALAACALAALAVKGLLGLAALGLTVDVHHIAFARTLTICALALALAYAGSHLRRTELTRLAYAALGLVAVKLLLEDLRHGQLAYIAASIFLFAVTLLVVPRLARMGKKA